MALENFNECMRALDISRLSDDLRVMLLKTVQAYGFDVAEDLLQDGRIYLDALNPNFVPKTE